jgi:CRP-like cAMP-binding protein
VNGGETLFEQGEIVDGGYDVQEGSFRLQSGGEGGGEEIAGEASLLCELALITETRSAFTAVAIEPSAVVRIPRALFLKMLEGYPDAARRLRDHLAVQTDQSVKEMAKVRAALDRRDG